MWWELIDQYVQEKQAKQDKKGDQWLNIRVTYVLASLSNKTEIPEYFANNGKKMKLFSVDYGQKRKTVRIKFLLER